MTSLSTIRSTISFLASLIMTSYDFYGRNEIIKWSKLKKKMKESDVTATGRYKGSFVEEDGEESK